MKKEVFINIDHNDFEIKCKVIFDTKIKSRIYVSVSSENNFYSLLAKAPYDTPIFKIEDLIIKNFEQLSVIKKNKENNVFLNQKKNILMYLGEVYPFEISIDANKRNKVKKIDNKFYVCLKVETDFPKAIESYFKKEAEKLIIPMAYEIANRYNLKFNEIKIKKLKRAWGNCKSRTKSMSFSLNLMHFKKEIIEYVICHELSHLIYPNHSRLFWMNVEKMYPDYKSARNQLRKYIV